MTKVSDVIPSDLLDLETVKLTKEMDAELKRISDLSRRASFETLFRQQLVQLRVNSWMEKNRIVETAQPFTTNQRHIYVSELKRIYARDRKTLMDFIMPITFVTAVVIILICMMIFWEDLAKPAIEVNRMRTEQMSMWDNIVKTQREISSNVQIMQSELSKNKPQEAPN